MGSCLSSDAVEMDAFLQLGSAEEDGDADLLSNAATSVVRPDDDRYFILFVKLPDKNVPDIYIQDSRPGPDSKPKHYLVSRDVAGMIRGEACYFGSPMSAVIKLNPRSRLALYSSERSRWDPQKAYYIPAEALASLAEVDGPIEKEIDTKQD